MQSATRCHITVFPDGTSVRGISANVKMAENTLLAELPVKLTTPEKLYPHFIEIDGVDPAGAPWKRMIENYRIKQRLSDLDETWAPYVSTLPTLAEHRERHLLFATDAVFDEFTFLPASHIVRGIRDELLAAAASVGDASSSAACEDFLWSEVSFMSRAFGPSGLVPLVDMFNSADVGGTNIKILSPTAQRPSFQIKADAALPPYTEWVHEYARGLPFIQSEQYALQFGFMPPSLPYNSLTPAAIKACRAWVAAHPQPLSERDGGQRKLFAQMAKRACGAGATSRRAG